MYYLFLAPICCSDILQRAGSFWCRGAETIPYCPWMSMLLTKPLWGYIQAPPKSHFRCLFGPGWGLECWVAGKLRALSLPKWSGTIPALRRNHAVCPSHTAFFHCTWTRPPDSPTQTISSYLAIPSWWSQTGLETGVVLQSPKAKRENRLVNDYWIILTLHWFLFA